MDRADPKVAPTPFEPQMVRIPAGEFLMGSDPQKVANAMSWEQPQHRLYLPDYDLAKTPVISAQYAAFVQASRQSPPRYWGDGLPPESLTAHPVVEVSWYEALAYCDWLSQVTGRAYRLPSEAEWEKGARGPWVQGSDECARGRTFPWGDRWDVRRCNTRESGYERTTPVEAYPRGASPYGLLDMAGNVWEWTVSLWGDDWNEPTFGYPYDANDGRENLEAGEDVFRVLRGGSAYVPRNFARCAYRYWSSPRFRNQFGGFRVAASL